MPVFPNPSYFSTLAEKNQSRFKSTIFLQTAQLRLPNIPL
jgi:hypothetical protein